MPATQDTRIEWLSLNGKGNPRGVTNIPKQTKGYVLEKDCVFDCGYKFTQSKQEKRDEQP